MPLRDAEGFLTGAAVFPLALSVAVGILVIGFAKGWRASASWLALGMISQAASRRNITVIMRQDDLPRAMGRLHEELFT